MAKIPQRLVCASAGAFFVALLIMNMKSVDPGVNIKNDQENSSIINPYFTVDSSEWMDSWRNASDEMYIFSAYFDPRLGNNATVVRVLGYMRRIPPFHITCYCEINNQRARMPRAKVQFLKEDHGAVYHGVFIICPYPTAKSSQLPRTIRVIVVGDIAATSESIPVHYRAPAPRIALNAVALCVRPFFNGVPKVHDLQHFLAYYNLHGVERFTFYAVTIPKDVEQFLWKVSKLVKVDLLPWSLPCLDRAFSQGQSAFTQDCLYRHASISRHVLIVDIDEYVFPSLTPDHRLHTVAELAAKLPRSKACFLMRNVFWIREPSSYDQPFIFTSLFRSLTTWPPLERSKYLADPLLIEECGSHSCTSFVTGKKKEKNVMTLKNAHVFHYWSARDDENYTVDTQMLAWKERMMSSPLMVQWLSDSSNKTQ